MAKPYPPIRPRLKLTNTELNHLIGQLSAGPICDTGKKLKTALLALRASSDARGHSTKLTIELLTLEKSLKAKGPY